LGCRGSGFRISPPRPPPLSPEQQRRSSQHWHSGSCFSSRSFEAPPWPAAAQSPTRLGFGVQVMAGSSTVICPSGAEEGDLDKGSGGNLNGNPGWHCHLLSSEQKLRGICERMCMPPTPPRLRGYACMADGSAQETRFCEMVPRCGA